MDTEHKSARKALHDTQAQRPLALPIVIRTQDEPMPKAHARLEELVSLIHTMENDTTEGMIITLREESPATLVGSGKVEELKILCNEQDIDTVIFDHDLNPRVQRNLEKELDLCVIDRQEVILQIFANRAQTREAVLQVALARQQYSLPRLSRRWTNLSQQRGGVKGSKGEGETQLELDRRVALRKIESIKDELQKVQEQRNIQRKSRSEGIIPTGAIVGYTNSGKSSLLKLLTNSDVLVEDKLFATLDPTTRKVKLNSGYEVLLTDTVGFVSDLPHDLVDAFRSTLEETTLADFLIIVCDASHPDMLNCYETTLQVLHSLGNEHKPTIVMINKMDTPLEPFAIARLASMADHVVQTSVKTGAGIDELQQQIEQIIHQLRPLHTYLFPNSRHDLVAWLRRNGSIETIDYQEQGILVTARISQRNEGTIKEFLQ